MYKALIILLLMVLFGCASPKRVEISTSLPLSQTEIYKVRFIGLTENLIVANEAYLIIQKKEVERLYEQGRMTDVEINNMLLWCEDIHIGLKLCRHGLERYENGEEIKAQLTEAICLLQQELSLLNMAIIERGGSGK